MPGIRFAEVRARVTMAEVLGRVGFVPRETPILTETDRDGIPIFVDPIGLKEAGVTMNSPVTVSSKAVPIKEALEDALGQLKLEYAVKDGWLLITSNESALSQPYP